MGPLPNTVVPLIATLMLRIAFAGALMFWSPSLSGFHALDTPSYLLPAKELSESFSFSIDGIPNIYRTPGYSLLLVPGIMAGKVEIWALFLNLVFAAGTVMVISRLAFRMTGSTRAAFAAGMLYAIDPLGIFHAAQLTSETAFTFLASAGILLLAEYAQASGERLRGLLWAALLSASATLVRPIGLYLPWVLAGCLAWGLIRAKAASRPGWPGWIKLAVFLGIAAAPPLAWQARNALAAGYPGLCAIVDVNNYYFQASAVLARVEGKTLLQARMDDGYEKELWLLEHPRERQEDQGAHFRALGAEGKAVLRKHPLAYLRIHLAGIFKVLTNPGASGYLVVYNRNSEVEALAGVYPDGGALQAVTDFKRFRPVFFWSNALLGMLLVAYYIAAARGLWLARKKWSMTHTLLLAAACYFAAVSGGANAVSRFRHPIMPILCIFAGAGLVRKPG